MVSFRVDSIRMDPAIVVGAATWIIGITITITITLTLTLTLKLTLTLTLTLPLALTPILRATSTYSERAG